MILEKHDRMDVVSERVRGKGKSVHMIWYCKGGCEGTDKAGLTVSE